MESEFLKKYIIIGLVMLILFFSAGYFYYNYENWLAPKSLKSNKEVDLSQAPVKLSYEPAPSELFDFKGTLYFSLIKINGIQALGINTYNINGDSGSKWKTILADDISNDKNYHINISPSVSDDGKKIVFARKKVSDLALQIFTSDVLGKNLQQITNTPDIYKREPVFSPSSDLIAYISHNTKSSASDPDPKIPENWSTYLTDINGKSIKVSLGINPLFSPDGKKLLVLQNDGLHLFDISDYKKPHHIGLVIPTVGGRASQTMKISLSGDRKMLAWSSIGNENLIVARINSWDVFSTNPFLSIKTKALWTAFSPDGKYLAVDEWRKDAAGNEYPVIMGYNLLSGKSEIIVTLTDNDKSFLWLGSWKP